MSVRALRNICLRGVPALGGRLSPDGIGPPGPGHLMIFLRASEVAFGGRSLVATKPLLISIASGRSRLNRRTCRQLQQDLDSGICIV